MAAMSVPGSPATAPGAARPYAPSWVHALTGAMDRLPGPRWVAYLGLAAVMIVLQHIQYWSTGRAEVGTVDRLSTYYGATIAAIVWLAGHLERTTRSGFERIRPALTVGEAEADRLGHELTIIPGRPAAAITIIGAVISIASFLADPEGAAVGGLPPAMLALAFATQVVGSSLVFQMLYWLLRQMRTVRDILDRAVNVDVFRPGPLHAIAALTARPGALLTLLVASVVLVVPVTDNLEAFLVGWGPYLIAPPLFAVVAFVAPLAGAHARLEAQKERLQDETEDRIRGLLEDLHRDVDARDLARADAYSKTLAALVTERDLLARLSTWPWSVSTLRRFISAIGLPLALFVTQQLVVRLL
jgi:hypothetical protein